jgi:hypothetical protein
MLNSRLSPSTLTLVLALSALSTSCWPRKSPKAFTPPPPSTQPQVPSNAPIVASEPPAIAGNPESTIPQAPPAIPEIPAPAAPKPTPPRRGTTPANPPRPTPTPPATEQPPPLRLGQIYTPDQQREYNRTIDEALNRVNRVLEALARKNLNTDQQTEVGRVATFKKQAEQAREAQDLMTAALLAQRADTLAQDLFARIP